MKKLAAVVMLIGLLMGATGVLAGQSDEAPAPNSGDGMPDGSGFDEPPPYQDDAPGSGPAPNSGDGIPDGSGFDDPPPYQGDPPVSDEGATSSGEGGMQAGPSRPRRHAGVSRAS